jgi:hypothetical protein
MDESTEFSNTARLARIRHALDLYAVATNDPRAGYSSVINDVLIDLRHFCDQENLDFDFKSLDALDAFLTEQIPLPLYYVRWNNEDGVNQDLLVRAVSVELATRSWRAHFGLASDTTPQWVGQVPLVNKPGPIDWGAIRPDGELRDAAAAPARAEREPWDPVTAPLAADRAPSSVRTLKRTI